MWKQYLRICKENAAIVLFADGLFMADLMESQRKLWRYNLVWDKVLTSGFLNANRQPLRKHEEICVFYKKQPTYNPQKVLGGANHSKGKEKQNANNNYGKYGWIDNREKLGNLKHPTSIIQISKSHPSVAKHPTEKPVELCEWLIKTYTNENEIVLDSCMGSGSTCIAAINTNRKYVGIELDDHYFSIASERINDHLYLK